MRCLPEGRKEAARWHRAQDLFFGGDHLDQALRLARESDHEEARWLCSLFPDEVTDVEDALSVFIAQGEEEKALFFAGRLWRFCGVGYVDNGDNESFIWRSAELGYAPAQAYLAIGCEGEEKFAWALKAAAQNDPTGLYELAHCYLGGKGCIRDEKGGLELLERSAEWGNADGQIELAKRSMNKKERMVWFSRAAERGYLYEDHFLAELARAVKLHAKSGLFGDVVFLGGTALSPLWSPDRVKLFVGLEGCGYCRRAMELFCFWTDSARETVVAWILCAKRLQLNKDVRRVISCMLWETRKQALHLLPS